MADEFKPRVKRGIIPQRSDERKDTPMATGVLDYFPAALAAVAQLSKAGNDKHNPGEPMHWARDKSTDHADCIMRHLAERGGFDEDGNRHSAALAWRALALLQTELETEGAVEVPITPRPVTQQGGAMLVIEKPFEEFERENSGQGLVPPDEDNIVADLEEEDITFPEAMLSSMVCEWNANTPGVTLLADLLRIYDVKRNPEVPKDWHKAVSTAFVWAGTPHGNLEWMRVADAGPEALTASQKAFIFQLEAYLYSKALPRA